ncbi:MAG: hypothetical protein GOMPHAMPRED_003661 [Gomphillus americanus]|uniref:Major facilitator superfamily (MFS) profile domain-containing protein n=1 Tax=Gomphillus americanus TaxID=1940652 RepID=A0A8H3FHD0_9LECA|nr:MAG: hypothetical protein GOMPHAMPRED_003661 [Gomphillus americanus]
MSPGRDEQQPLLSNSESYSHGQNDTHKQKVDFEEDDPENPQNWPVYWKYAVVFQVSMIAFFLPLTSSMYAPVADNIGTEYGADDQIVLLNQSGYVCMLGIGPLLWAPMSETFGRRTIYLLGLVIFTLIQIPIALAPDIETFVIFRTLSGFFGSVGVGNGGGSISDMFGSRDRSKAVGFYMIWPLLAPTIGPLIGGIMVDHVNWHYLSWFNLVTSGILLVACYFFLHETRAITILQHKKHELEKEDSGTEYYIKGDSQKSFTFKVTGNATRALKILFTQPIVLTMSIYQALIFSTMYSLYAQYTSIWTKPPYQFTKTEVGFAYLGPAIGFVLTSIIVILSIDKVYDWAAKRNDSDGQPEYRLPLANVGALLLPVSLFWFGWTVEKGLHWSIPLIGTVLFGASQVGIFNTVQTYYIDAYASNAASALAAGSFLRSIVGAIVPLFVGKMFDKLGYGWGMSVFGAIAVLLMPAPLLFYWFGKRLRESYPFEG